MSLDFDPTERLRRSLADRGPGPALSIDVVTGAPHRSAPRLADPRRRAQVAGGAVLALAAVTTGALVLGSMPRAPLFSAATAGPAGLQAEDATAGLRIGRWVQYEYVPGAGLGTAGGNGTVYQLRLAGSARAVLERAAAALGVTGDVAESGYSDPAVPSYVIGPEDGSAPSVGITWSGTGNWWYGDPAAYPSFECETRPADGEGDARADCVVPEPRLEDSRAPGDADARAFAQRLFTATGLDVAARDIRVTADARQTVAAASFTVDGVETALEWSVAWSAFTGRVAWASGHSVEVVDRGRYGMVSPADAVARLADWRWYGAPGPDYMGGVRILAADALRAQEDATADLGNGENPGAGEEPGAGDPGDDPAEPGAQPGPSEEPLPEPLPEPEAPEAVVVTVERAEPTLLLLWDADGGAWLVPGYAMQHPEGWWNAVVAVVEGVIALPEPMEIEPLIID